MTSTPFPPPPRRIAADGGAPPLDVAKGAWGGAWTVVYGCVGLLFGVMNIVSQQLLLRLVRLGTAALGKQVIEEEDAAFPKRVASVIERAPEALGLDLAKWHWAAVGLAVASIVAGFAVLRRSEVGRRAAIACTAASAGLAVALTVTWGVFVMPRYAAWIEELREVTKEIERNSGGAGGDLSVFFSSSSAQQLVWQIGMQIVHVGLVWMLIVRLRGSETTTWCGASASSRDRSS
ncbi:MAG: hypothetical protein K8T90_01000 [Planctomycetes bacterium]|nr:hypothetical protein [Planctomycetota bacterium]